MSKITKKIFELIKDKKIWIFTITAIVFFGVLSKMEFATDTYCVFSSGAKVNAEHFLSNGRFISAFATVAIRLLYLNQTAVYILSFLLAIFCLVSSLYVLEKIISKDINNPVISTGLSILIILNVFIIELFLFIEKGILILSILMSVLAIKHLIKYFETKKIKEIFIILIYMFIANGSYQGTVALFIILATIYIIKYSKNFKEFLINNCIMAVCYIIPAILDFIITKIVAFDARISGNINIFESIKNILLGTKDMLFTYNIMPQNAFLIFVSIIIVITVFYIIKSDKKISQKILNIFFMIYIILGTFIATLLPQIMQNTESIWITARSTYGFATLPGIILLFLYMNFNVHIKTNNIIIFISLIFLILQLYSFNKIEIDRYILNYEDKKIAIDIIEKINEYEETTGITVNNIAIYNDQHISYSYPNIFITKDLNIRAFSSDWATIGIIKYYSGKNLISINKDPEIEKQFMQKDWKNFDYEQLKFEDNVLHFCYY